MWNYIGIAILILGTATAEFVYWRGQHRPQQAADPLLWQYDSGAYQREVQTYVGSLGLLIDELKRSLAKLGEPGPMAITIVVAAAAAAGVCFFIAWRMRRE
jgi:hypothetical protein